MEICEQEQTKVYLATDPRYLRDAGVSLEHYLELHCSEENVDIASGCPGCFIRGFCGYNQWIGFNYGKKPTWIGSFFNLHTIKESFDGIAMFLGVLGLLILILPIPIGILIGHRMGKRRGE
jgi:hypothetical protein